MSYSLPNFDYLKVLINEKGALAFVVRNWLPDKESQPLLEQLASTVPFAQAELQMYGKPVLTPRQMYGMGDKLPSSDMGDDARIHTYSNTDFRLNPWIPEVEAIRNRIVKESGCHLNSCLMNEYKDGSQYIAYHSDREAMGFNNIVVTVSLGGSRDFYFKSKFDDRPTIQTVLYNGDCCVMFGDCQKLFTHSIPKRAHGEYRIALTFRELL